MAPVKADQIIISTYKVQAGRRCLADMNLFFALIDDFHATCNNVVFRQNAVQKHCLHFCHSVLHQDFQCLCFVFCGIDRRQTRKRIFPIYNPMALIAQITAIRAVTVFHGKSRTAEISGSACREFLWQRIHGIGSVLVRIIRIGGKSSVIIGQQIIHSPVDRLPII